MVFFCKWTSYRNTEENKETEASTQKMCGFPSMFTNLKNTENLLFTICLVIPYPFSSVFIHALIETGCILALVNDKTITNTK